MIITMLETLLYYCICLHNLNISNEIKEIERLREINHSLIMMVCEEISKGNTTIYLDTMMEDEGTNENCIELLQKYMNDEHQMNSDIRKLRLQTIRI